MENFLFSSATSWKIWFSENLTREALPWIAFATSSLQNKSYRFNQLQIFQVLMDTKLKIYWCVNHTNISLCYDCASNFNTSGMFNDLSPKEEIFLLKQYPSASKCVCVSNLLLSEMHWKDKWQKDLNLNTRGETVEHNSKHFSRLLE